jgi:hypothetical protein
VAGGLQVQFSGGLGVLEGKPALGVGSHKGVEVIGAVTRLGGQEALVHEIDEEFLGLPA